jgi:hypothetical protein
MHDLLLTTHVGRVLRVRFLLSETPHRETDRPQMPTT